MPIVVILVTILKIFCMQLSYFLLTENSFNSNFKYQDDLFVKSLINTKCKGHQGLDTLEAPLWSLASGLAQNGGYSLLILMNSSKVAYQNFCLCRNELEFFDKKYKWLHENPVDFFHRGSPFSPNECFYGLGLFPHETGRFQHLLQPQPLQPKVESDQI